MEPIVLLQHKWGLTFHIPWYLFLGGLAGGTLIVAAVADLLGGREERYHALSQVAAYITLPIIALGGLFLTLHLGKPERGVLFPIFMTNYRSWMTIGGWVIAFFLLLNIAYAATWYFRGGRTVRWTLAVLSIPTGIGMALYTGFLITGAWMLPAGAWFVPFWDNRYIPVLFLLSGLSTGLAASGLGVLLAGHLGWLPRIGFSLQGGEKWAKTLSLWDALVILLEAGWIYLFVTALAAGGVGKKLVHYTLTQGELAPWFWWGVILIGLTLPFIASLLEVALVKVRGRGDWLLYIKFTLVLVGGLILRYVVVWGGDLKTPLFFPPSLWPIP
jgi:formate-dependent nitrite reductase membrane component NrfD